MVVLIYKSRNEAVQEIGVADSAIQALTKNK